MARSVIELHMLTQDLHIHTTYSTTDNSVVPEQTVALVAAVGHAKVVGISDHFECLLKGDFESYAQEIRGAGLKVGVEVDGHPWVDQAVTYPVDNFVFHCRDQQADYRCLDPLLATDKPVIVAHPNAFETDLTKVPAECLIEIDNRYTWRTNWEGFYRPLVDHFRFVISSDAHQPNWLGQAVARHVVQQLGIEEHLVF